MKNEEILSAAMGLIDENLIIKANEKRVLSGRKFSAKSAALKFIPAACLALAACVFLLIPKGVGAEALAEAVYPKAAKYTSLEILPSYRDWGDDNAERRAEGAKISAEIKDFYSVSSASFLINDNNENLVYSPVNVYIALSMLAETTEGQSREQILKLLGQDNIENVRLQANALWRANYRNDGATTSILANSLWLDDKYVYEKNTAETLAKNYYASTYRGSLSSEKTQNALREWINKQTQGLLKNAANNIEHDPLSAADICSTVYFRAKWEDEFSASKNDKKIFHAPSGDIETEFMNNIDPYGTYYAGEDFGAIFLSFENRGGMWLILPDENKTINDVLSSGEYLEMMSSPETWEKKKPVKINYSVPKFDISSDIDLSEGLKALGVSDIFDMERSDFSPLTSETDKIFISRARQAARVVIDEKGCTAAAFAALLGAGSSLPNEDETDFVLDRPFVFAVTSDTRQPLFIGTVNHP